MLMPKLMPNIIPRTPSLNTVHGFVVGWKQYGQRMATTRNIVATGTRPAGFLIRFRKVTFCPPYIQSVKRYQIIIVSLTPTMVMATAKRSQLQTWLT